MSIFRIKSTVDKESNLKPSISAIMMNSSNMDVVNCLREIDSFNPNVQDLLSLTAHVGFSDHNHQQSQIPFSFSNDTSHNPNTNHHHHLQVPLNFESAAHFFPQEGFPISHGCNDSNSLSEPDHLANSSSRGSPSAGVPVNKAKGIYKYGEKKRKRNNGKETEKLKEVVHVRAKRGQATDSHSLAERMRREKINQKLRSLQDLVPGCYKSMGMAVMLDVIINYVRSLQNQIDFLSMKLSAASLFYDFNSLDMDAIPPTQGTHGYDAQGLEKMVGEGYGELPQFHTSWPL